MSIDTEEECIHGIWPATACTTCNGKDRRAETEIHWRTFTAKYVGHCGGCNLPINIGATIAWHEDMGAYHEGCEP